MIPIISKDINYPRICILQDEMKLFKIISIKYEKIYIAILTLSNAWGTPCQKDAIINKKSLLYSSLSLFPKN